MKLLIVDESGAIVQEYGDITAQMDGMDIEGNVLKAVIPGALDTPVEADGNAAKPQKATRTGKSSKAWPFVGL